MTCCRDFVRSLIKTSSAAKAARQQICDEWQPDEPPVTTLFAAMGDRIIEEFNNVDFHEMQQIFFLIEQAMGCDDEGLVTAVATGLIEALVTRAVQREDLWKQVTPLLGPKTRRHAEAWLAG